MSNYFNSLGIQRIDHVELATNRIDELSNRLLHLGFQKVAERQIQERQLQSILFAQNEIRFLISQSTATSDPIFKFCESHGDGVFDVSFLCHDAINTFEKVLSRGAKAVVPPKSVRRDFGTCTFASILTPSDLRHTFISRTGTLFHEGFDDPLKYQNQGRPLENIHHFCLCVGKNDLSIWSDFYQSILGLEKTTVSTLHSHDDVSHYELTAIENTSIQIGVFEAHRSSTVFGNDFVETFHGPGIHHIGLAFSKSPESPQVLSAGFSAAPLSSFQALSGALLVEFRNA